jgi:crossover junction endodeoxyribonuclease RusA
MLSFRLDYPPTVNRYWRHWRGMVVLSPEGRRYRQAAMEFAPPEPILSRVSVALQVTMPDKRKRDLDNVLKAVLDALGHARIYRDDSQVDRLVVERIGIEPPGCVDVFVDAYLEGIWEAL